MRFKHSFAVAAILGSLKLANAAGIVILVPSGRFSGRVALVRVAWLEVPLV